MVRVPARLAICSGLAVLGWAGAILGDGSAQWLTMIFILWGVSAAVFAYPLLTYVPSMFPARRGSRTFRVADLHQDYFTAFWMRVEVYVPHIRRMRERYADLLRKKGSGLMYDHDFHATRAVHLALTVLPLVSVPVVTGEVATMMAAMAPAVGAYPLLQLQGRVRQHTARVEEEMSFFLCYLTVMQGVGYTLFAALERMREAPDVFVAMARDAASVTQSVTLGAPQMDALREYAARHPVPAFKDFLYGYISKHETVGQAPAYTEAKAEQFFELYKQTWNNYKTAALMLASMAVMVSVIIPVMMVMMIFIATQSTVNLVLTMGPLMGPVFALMLLFMVGASQPTSGVVLKPWLPSIGIGAGVALLVHFLWLSTVPGGNIWDTEPGVTISLAFLAAGLSNYLMVRKHLGGAADVDRALPEFLEDVTEQTRAGSSITTILAQQAHGSLYYGLFGRLLRGIVTQLDGGSSMEDACREARKHSRYLSFVLFIIIRLQELGSTDKTPHVLQLMTRFMASTLTTKIDVTKSLRTGAIMIYVAPVMLVGITNAMFTIFDDGTSASAITNMLPPGAMDSFQPPDPDSGYKQRLGMLAALVTCPMGLVASKISNFTAVNTMPLAIVAAVSTVSLLAIPHVIGILGL